VTKTHPYIKNHTHHICVNYLEKSLVPEHNAQIDSKDKFFWEMPFLVGTAGYVDRVLKEASEICPCNSNCSSDCGLLLRLMWCPVIRVRREGRLCPQKIKSSKGGLGARLNILTTQRVGRITVFQITGLWHFADMTVSDVESSRG